MTTNNPQQFDPSKQNSPDMPPSAHQRGGYNPVTLEDVQRSTQGGFLNLPFGSNGNGQLFVATLFILIFILCQIVPPLAPVTILILLAALLARLEARVRNIVAVPIAISAAILACSVLESSSVVSPSSPSGLLRLTMTDYGLPWLPLFFAACLVYIPAADSSTFKVVLAESFLIMTSGLIPGSGCLVIFYLIHYTLFIVMAVAIFHDIKHYKPVIPLISAAATSH